MKKTRVETSDDGESEEKKTEVEGSGAECVPKQKVA